MLTADMDRKVNAFFFAPSSRAATHAATLLPRPLLPPTATAQLLEHRTHKHRLHHPYKCAEERHEGGQRLEEREAIGVIGVDADSLEESHFPLHLNEDAEDAARVAVVSRHEHAGKDNGFVDDEQVNHVPECFERNADHLFEQFYAVELQQQRDRHCCFKLENQAVAKNRNETSSNPEVFPKQHILLVFYSSQHSPLA